MAGGMEQNEGPRPAIASGSVRTSRRRNGAKRESRRSWVMGWPGCYAHESLAVFLTVYVDDFKMSGRTADVDKAWKLISEVNRFMWLVWGVSLKANIFTKTKIEVKTVYNHSIEGEVISLGGLVIAIAPEALRQALLFTVYIVYCILHTVYCILYTVYCILYTVYRKLYTVVTVYSLLLTVYCIQFLHTVYCILYIVHCVLYSVYCILYTPYCIL